MAVAVRPTLRLQNAFLLVVLTLIYFLMGKLGLALAFVHANASAVWPPTGIALAALLLFGLRVWPAILIGAFLVNVTTAVSVSTALGIAGGNTLEALIGVWLVRRYAGGAAAFERPQGVIRFVTLAAVGSTTVSATIGVLSLWIGGHAEATRLAEIWLTWWLGDAVGALVFTPLIVLWAKPLSRPTRGWLEASALAATIVVIGWVVFIHRAPIAYLALPPLVWAAFRFGRRGAVTAAVALSGIALWGTLHGYGPFVVESPHESLLFLQAFVGVITLTALVLAADMRERERAEGALRRARGELEASVQERTASLREAVRQLEESRSVLSEAQRVAHVGSWEWDIRADRVTWSDELYRIYGLHPDSGPMTYESYLERVHPDDREKTAAAIRTAFAGADSFEFEERILRPDGQVRVLHSRGYVEKDGVDVPRRMIGTCHDITERKAAEIELERRMEELARSNAELTVFTHVASHDLKEPLRTVASNVQLVERRMGKVDDPEVRRSIGFAVDGVRRMDEMITDLLEYSRAGRSSKVAVDAGHALAGAVERIHSVVAETGARIENGSLPSVVADPNRLVQLFQNLLSNAIKYRDSARVPEIRVAAERQGPMWMIEIADNGRGFESDEADRIFDLFERLHQDHEIPGTGIGLAICRRIVETHGGRIWAESEPGRGSVFRFTLPASVPEAGTAL
jgi:PAS domain S-box-containing protein